MSALPRKTHWLVRLNFRWRVPSFALVFVTLGAHMHEQGGYPLWAWALLVLQFLLFPYLAYLHARMRREPMQGELDNLLAEAAFYGAWAAGLGFPDWISYGLFLGGIINLGVNQGLRGMLLAMAAFGVSAALVSGALGWRFEPHTGTLATAMSMVSLGFFLVGIMLGSYARTQRLREVRVQLQQNLQQVQALQAQRDQLLLQEERRRIVSEMHDGLGSQLVSARTLIDEQAGVVAPAQFAEAIDGALLDLRNVLDVLSTTPGEASEEVVSNLLGSLRWRIEPALRAKHIALNWRVDPLPAGFLPTERERLQLMRLLQEAFTNVLKHSQAHQLQFSARADAQGVTLMLQDDGIGFDANTRQGLGLGNMRKRAARLNATLSIDSAPRQGTQVRLHWPGSRPG